MRLLVLAAVVPLALAATPARAASSEVEGLIGRGLELRRESRPEEALDLFRRAHAAAPSPRTFGQMGLVEASLEHWLDAEAHLTASLATAGDAWVRKNRGLLRQALGIIRRHIGELVISGPPGTTVAIDGKAVGTLPFIQPLRVVEGNAAIVASGAGFRSFSKTVAIAGGARVSLAIVLDPVEERPALALSAPAPLLAPAPALAIEPPLRPDWKRWAGAGLFAAGAGALTWGIVWIVVDGSDQCSIAGPACRSVFDTKTPGWLLAAGGTAAAAAGAALLLTGRRGDEANVTLAATPSSLSLRGRF